MQKKLLFWGYFLIGAIANTAVLLLPFFYAGKGMGDMQIVYLLSSTYLASIVQPALGYIADTTIGPKKMLKNVSFGIVVISIIMYFSRGFLLLFILSFIFSIFRNATFPLFDNLAIGYCEKHKIEYGGVRKGGSIGFGLGVLISVPLYSLLGTNALILIPTVLAFILIYIVKDVEYSNNLHVKVTIKDYKNDLNELLKSKKYLLLIVIHLMIMGLCTIKLSYQSTYIESLNVTILYIVILNMFLVIPEIILISRTKKIFSKFNISFVFMILIIINIIHASILYFTTSTGVILIFSVMHGIVMSIYIPTFFSYLAKVMPKGAVSTGYLINATFQSLGSFLINTLLISTFVYIYGIKGSFLMMIILFILALIPIWLLFQVNKNEK